MAVISLHIYIYIFKPIYLFVYTNVKCEHMIECMNEKQSEKIPTGSQI